MAVTGAVDRIDAFRLSLRRLVPRPAIALPATLLLGAVILPSPAAGQVEQFSVIANGETVGNLTARSSGSRTSIDYLVRDNGRGPKHHEEIVIGKGSIPTSWTIDGTSLMGGAVGERFEYKDGRADWTSQADHGSVPVATPALYIANDDSPWAKLVYLRAALAHGGSIAALPTGRIVATRLKDVKMGAVTATAYRLDGVQLTPDYLMVDKGGRLLATFDAKNVTIRAGKEALAPTLYKMGADLEGERIRSVSAAVAHRYDGPVRIRNVHIFDPISGTTGPLSTIAVMRDRITQVLPGDGGDLAGRETVIDGQGGTLVPGLADMHSHTTVDSGLFYLAAGVTLTRDMGNKNDFLIDLMPRVERAEIAGPHIVPNGFIEGRSPYSARLGFIPSTLDEAKGDVRWYADRGYREIKLYNSFNPDWVKPIAAEAHGLGMGVTGHVPAFDTPDRVIADGYDTIAHINQLMLGWLIGPKEDTRTILRLTAMTRAADLDLQSPRVQHTIGLMEEHHTSLDTTAVILERLMLSRAGTVAEGDAAYLSHMPIGYQRYRKRTFVPLPDAAEDQRYRLAFDKLLATLRLLYTDGIRLLPGTDDTSGFTVQRELELYVKAGIPAPATLSMATLGAARYLGEDHDRGTIVKGKLADFVLLPDDPAKNISAIRQPRMVMRGGIAYFPAEIYRAIGIEPFASAPPVISPTKPEEPSNGSTGGSYFSADPHDGDEPD